MHQLAIRYAISTTDWKKIQVNTLPLLRRLTQYVDGLLITSLTKGISHLTDISPSVVVSQWVTELQSVVDR